MKYKLITICLFLCYASFVSAGNDPMKKPKVWKMLQESPNDNALWAAYLGKSWICMTIHEKENIEKWRGTLKTGTSNSTPSTGVHIALTPELQKEIDEQVFSETDEFWEGEALQSDVTQQETVKEQEALKAHFVEMEQRMVMVPPAITRLSRNLRENFVLIEDEFAIEYEALGLSYESYWDIYPNGKYSPEKWVYEHNMELKKLKKVEFEKIKHSMLASVASTNESN
ncbi:hypothetical protein [Flammeovirga agarivorans]|uniref:YARHG domain-containing protein n=1 Tax=Flammeovirga agarivorans TaxID=2726742 RepID=A0A7X8SMY4_9BACT|nr:hypothetical protein [Flammeovirga agarivorans]NLR93097.1 hypothetical protein [Flammeovirga agarivorans]